MVHWVGGECKAHCEEEASRRPPQIEAVRNDFESRGGREIETRARASEPIPLQPHHEEVSQ